MGRQEIPCIAAIKQNSTGEIREFPIFLFIEEGETEPDFYDWECGNYSCDCNREEFFYCVGEQYEYTGYSGCSDDRFSVNIFNEETKEVIYKEYE